MPGASILLSTLNSSYSHAAFGLRYLYANLAELKERAEILEFTIAQNPRDIAEKILARNPSLVGFGVYIWNTEETRAVVSILKRVRPELTIVLGGPEVSFETEGQAIVELADFVIAGEADFLFRDFCREILAGRRPAQKIIRGELPDVNEIILPYAAFSDHDVAHRVLYVEASRGCPYKCEYCLSSLDKSVRNFPLEKFLASIETLIARGARRFKFVDRTFNLSPSTSGRILNFFLERISLGLFLHFEMVPDRLPAELAGLIKQFPKGSLQFEIGVQTWNPEVAALVSRRQDYRKIEENFRFLRSETGVHTHADLIVGLPGETFDSFARGFDALASLEPDEIQVGILKRLNGTPIIRHDGAWEMKYADYPPFQVLSTKTMDYALLQKFNRFAKFWDLYANSGNFPGFTALLKNSGASFFQVFWEFSEFLGKRHAESYGISLLHLVESAWVYGTTQLALEPSTLRETLIQDYSTEKKRDVPHFLRVESERASPRQKIAAASTTAAAAPQSLPPRQSRRLANTLVAGE